MSDLFSEETARRIADELKRLADILDRQKPIMPSYPPAQPIPAYDPNRCGVCGGHHYGNMPCPALTPTTASVRWTP